MEKLLAKAAQIELAIFDVDGVLTNGKIYLGNNGEELKSFHIQDGLGLELLQKSGVAVAIITGMQSELVQHRMEKLGIQHVYQNQKNKLNAYHDLRNKLKLCDEQIAYVGDDWLDLPIIQRVGLGVAVANARIEVKKAAAWTTLASGGHGAVREVCEWIMRAKNTLEPLLQAYLQQESSLC